MARCSVARFNRRSRATSFAARLNEGARDLAPRDVSKCP